MATATTEHYRAYAPKKCTSCHYGELVFGQRHRLDILFQSREILAWCARERTPCLLVLARPCHMDPGIGHEIEVDLQA